MKKDEDWHIGKTPLSSCKLRPTKHLTDRMKDTQRGWSKDEVIKATFFGSKHKLCDNKYIGRYGPCRVLVIKKKCNTVITVYP